MRKYGLVAVLSAIMLLSGCNANAAYESSLSELESMIQERDNQISELQNKIAQLEDDNSVMSSDISKYLEQIDEFENGLPRLLSEVLNAFESKDYKTTIELAEEFHQKYNGSAEDAEVQSVLKQAQDELDRIEAEAKAEEERKAAEAARTAEEKVHGLIQIHELKVNDINSVGGVDVKIAFTNCSDKTIKYITFTVEPYNAVGDKVKCEITKDDTALLQVTGPIEAGEGSEYEYGEWWGAHYWNAVWYNSTIKTIKLTGIEIQYTDKKKVEISGEDLNYVFW